MKRMLTSRLCALAMGATFCADSNAIHFSRLDGVTILMDIAERFPLGTQTSITCLPETILSMCTFMWNGSEFRLYMGNMSSPQYQNIPFIDRSILPSDFMAQVNELMEQQSGSANENNKLLNLYLEEESFQNKLNQNRSKLETVLNSFKSNANSNIVIKKNIRGLVESKIFYSPVFEKNEVTIIMDSTGTSDFTIDFAIPEKPDYMSREDYSQELENLYEKMNNWNNVLNSIPIPSPINPLQ